MSFLRMKSLSLAISFGLVFFIEASFSQEISHFSPSQNIKADIFTGKHLKMDVAYKDVMVLKSVEIGLDLEGKAIDYSIYATEAEQIKVVSHDVVPVKFGNQITEFSQLILSFGNGIQWELMISDEGLAYRWTINRQISTTIVNELLSFELGQKDISWFPKEDKLISHYERMYLKLPVDSIKTYDFCSLPVLFQKENGLNIFFSEANLFNYPNLFLQKGDKETIFKAIFPHYVLSVQDNGSDRNETITEEAPYIAIAEGFKNLPWRVFGLAESDAGLLKNNMVYQLSSPLKLENTDWIKPGKVAWDWWNDNNIYGVDFQSGINNETYKYYIDFASEYGLEYIILDEGWSKTTTDIMHCNPDINVPELVQYGAKKNVGIILWTLWKPLDLKMDSVLNLYEKWGVKGVKVDFMQRADQAMVSFYEKAAKEAAKRHLLVDFHGAFKPAGMRKAYPNIVNYEGLKGLENTKWSKLITPEHNLTLPFIRMVAGPMDYTPGAMDNAHEKDFAIRWSRPMSMGTRCHQVAMYVVYEAPLQMLADNPSNYYKEQETTRFIAQIPTTWDTTIVLDAKIGENILMARRNGNSWYVGGMAVNEKAVEIDLGFLPKGKYEVEYMQDGVNSDRNAQDYKHGKMVINSGDKLSVSIHKAGGFAAIFRKTTD